MARVTIEDCLEKVDDRFELVAVAAQRARNIAAGAGLTIERKGEKDTVIALREIAEGTVEITNLREDLVKSNQKEVSKLEEFVSPSNNSDSIEIDAEDAEIRAAIAEAAESGLDQSEELEDGFNSDEQMFSDDNVEVND
jgi:DNA-directed RNA polymerase subunit omega